MKQNNAVEMPFAASKQIVGLGEALPST